MNITSYTLDSLRNLVRELQSENQQLKKQLELAGIPFDTHDIFEDADSRYSDYDPDQGERIYSRYIDEALANRFFGMFWGRMDVYAKRGAKGGYFPQCHNRWDSSKCPKNQNNKFRCSDCENTEWTRLEPRVIVKHLLGLKEDGSDVIGIYPLLPDGTCRFLVFDFDNHEKGSEQNDYANLDNSWRDEVDALRKICEDNGLSPLVERSRSGRGAHVWLFFAKPISASLARNFGFLLLDKGAEEVNLKSFQYYDRMYPSQDSSDGIGNLVALPLQGQALKMGNSAFVDRNWNAYPDQWDILLNKTPKLTIEDIERLMLRWQNELIITRGVSAFVGESNRPKPWKRDDRFISGDVVGKLHISLGDSIYVDTLNLMPRIQNQIRSLAAFDNPIYYKNKRLGYSNYNNFSAIYLGKDVDGYISIPRGLRDKLMAECRTANIPFDVEDNREKGRRIRVSFNGSLRETQELASKNLLAYDNGILEAATSFGKTVVCSYLIAKRKVSTLILLQSKDLLEQWIDELGKFLTIDEEPPVYRTKSGREKRRDSVIGFLHGGKNALTGIVDVAMVGSMYSKGEFNELINSYGMVIMDECHHCGSATSVQVIQKINARYVYGVSATIKRGDNLEKIIHMLIGPVRHSYSAKEQSVAQGIGRYVYPRYTRIVSTNTSRQDISAAFALVSGNELRNEMIIEDTKDCVADGRTPVILTKYKEQAKYLYEKLLNAADNVYLLYGGNKDKENTEIRNELKAVPRDKSLILIATGQKIGEGFDFPRLDTLMLAAPVSFEGRVEQYIGRLTRNYEGKKDVIVYDYIDSHIRVFDNMYANRLRTYKSTGFQVIEKRGVAKQEVNAIYDSGNYIDVFEQDIVEAEKQIIISSPELIMDKVDRFIYLAHPRQEAGCTITVITTNPEYNSYSSSYFSQLLIDTMVNNGINVITREEVVEHFAVIDVDLVWHGGMNLLGKEDVWDNLMRIKSAKVAAELLEIGMR